MIDIRRLVARMESFYRLWPQRPDRRYLHQSDRIDFDWIDIGETFIGYEITQTRRGFPVASTLPK